MVETGKPVREARITQPNAPAATAIADQLWQRSAGTVWSRLAERTLFRYGLARWKSGDRSVAADGVFKVIAQPGDDGNLPITTGGHAFIITAREAGVVEITGDTWEAIIER